MIDRRYGLWIMLVLVVCVCVPPRVRADDTAVTRKKPQQPRDQLWCNYRGPADGRAWVPEAPAPPLTLAWKINLWDADQNGDPRDAILFAPRNTPAEGSPLGMGVAWRVDEQYLYAFEMAFYRTTQKSALFNRHTGELLSQMDVPATEPLPDKRVASIHDDSGLAVPLVFFGNFYGGRQLMTVEDDRLELLQPKGTDISLIGHACEGQRWLNDGFYLSGGGAEFKAGPRYRWGHHLFRYQPGQKREAILENVSVPCVIWNDEGLVLFTRGGLTAKDMTGTFAWQEYVHVGLRDNKPQILERRRVTDREKPTGEQLFEDPPQQVMSNRARNAVKAMAFSADGQWVYCHERSSSTTQRIVRRSLKDFAVDGRLPEDFFPRVTEQGAYAQANVELDIGFAVDAERFYVHRPRSLDVFTLDLRERLYQIKLPVRLLDAHCPYAMCRYLSKTNMPYACRGTENSIATDGRHVYLTTDTTLQVHRADNGELVWEHTFDDLPTYTATITAGNQRVSASAAAYPGDIMLTRDAVYVATHNNQSLLYCFRKAE